MAGIDLEAIKAKIEQLKTVKNAKVPFWKPEEGEYLVRIIPSPDAPSDDPFFHLSFYYNIRERGGILCPNQFNKPDPVEELRAKLWQGDAKDKEAAKQLFPSTRHYITIIDRADEEKGTQLWSFGKTVYLRLMSFFADPDIGDYFDEDEGYDLKVVIEKKKGASYPTTTVDVARKPSCITKDPQKLSDWKKGVLNPMDAYTESTSEEIEKMLSDWLSAGTESDDPGMERGSSPESLDDAIASLKSSDTSNDEKSNLKKKRGKSQSVEQITNTSISSVDDVFNKVMGT